MHWRGRGLSRQYPFQPAHSNNRWRTPIQLRSQSCLQDCFHAHGMYFFLYCQNIWSFAVIMLYVTDALAHTVMNSFSAFGLFARLACSTVNLSAKWNDLSLRDASVGENVHASWPWFRFDGWLSQKIAAFALSVHTIQWSISKFMSAKVCRLHVISKIMWDIFATSGDLHRIWCVMHAFTNLISPLYSLSIILRFLLLW